MKFEVKNNKNYCGTIVQIDNLINLEGCDNIQGTIIYGCHIIISKETKIGDIGIYFPSETALSDAFLSSNNLYREKEMNKNKGVGGFFEKNRRIRTMKLRGFKSEGFFTPLTSLNFIIDSCDRNILSLEIGTEFDHIDNTMLCEKYIIPKKQSSQPGDKKSKKNKKIKRFNKLREEIFRFHIDTNFLAKNVHRVTPTSIISVTEKLHGTSAIASYILCNKKLTCVNQIARWLGIDVQLTNHDYIYASRRVVKNQYLYKDKKFNHYYSENIWERGATELKPYLQKGMSLYYEIVGFLNDGRAIQGKHPHIFDYGCAPGEHKNYIYRITSTNEDGKVFEWSMLQIQQWCKLNGLLAVPLHYYGYARDLFPDIAFLADTSDERDTLLWQHKFLEKMIADYLEKDCVICKNKVPAEGIVLRLETLDIDPFKLKSFAFKALETKLLDAGEENIEDNQETTDDNEN